MKKLFGYFLISLPLMVIDLGLAYTFYTVEISASFMRCLGESTLLVLISIGFTYIIRLCIDFGVDFIYADE